MLTCHPCAGGGHPYLQGPGRARGGLPLMRTLSAEAMITELLPCPHQLWPHKGTLKERNASWAFCKALLESTLVRSIVTAHCSPAVEQRYWLTQYCSVIAIRCLSALGCIGMHQRQFPCSQHPLCCALWDPTAKRAYGLHLSIPLLRQSCANRRR